MESYLVGGTLVEVCCAPDSNLGNVSSEFRGVTVIRVDEKADWSLPRTVKRIRDDIIAKPGTSLHGSRPCTPWTT